jgi:hyperosmotically inducible protein
LAAILAAGCAQAPQERSAGQVMDDTVIASRVNTALMDSKTTKSKDINVEVRRGEVQLAGFVDSEAERQAAGEITRKIEGVRKVDNSLQIRKGELSAGQTVDDGLITVKVKSALIQDSRTKAYQIDVNTHGGTVQLAGFVDSRDAKTVAQQIAAAVEGVRNVQNDLEVRQ